MTERAWTEEQQWTRVNHVMELGKQEGDARSVMRVARRRGHGRPARGGLSPQ
jgi:hypothetical protein